METFRDVKYDETTGKIEGFSSIVTGKPADCRFTASPNLFGIRLAMDLTPGFIGVVAREAQMPPGEFDWSFVRDADHWTKKTLYKSARTLLALDKRKLELAGLPANLVEELTRK